MCGCPVRTAQLNIKYLATLLNYCKMLPCIFHSILFRAAFSGSLAPRLVPCVMFLKLCTCCQPVNETNTHTHTQSNTNICAHTHTHAEGEGNSRKFVYKYCVYGSSSKYRTDLLLCPIHTHIQAAYVARACVCVCCNYVSPKRHTHTHIGIGQECFDLSEGCLYKPRK